MSTTGQSELKAIRAELDRLSQSVGEHKAPFKFVLNLSSGVLHKLESIDMLDSHSWCTTCGWRFSQCRFRLLVEPSAAASALEVRSQATPRVLTTGARALPDGGFRAMLAVRTLKIQGNRFTGSLPDGGMRGMNL
eukprot:2420295-Amphidinium_carterae.1